MRFRGWIPLVLLAALIVAVGTYTAVRQDAFLTEYNINNLLLATMPLALVSLGQTNALLVGGFDVSVAALVTMCVVTASTFAITWSGCLNTDWLIRWRIYFRDEPLSRNSQR